MRYIDKFKQQKQAHSINVRFLQDCYAYDLTNPIPSPDNPLSSFEDFKKPEYRDNFGGWKALLYKEQDDRCCYCMRKLSTVNYEHVIPRSITSRDIQDVQYYMQYAPALQNFVEIADIFTSKKFNSTHDISNEIKMPHITALANLLVACNGKLNSPLTSGCCCNHNRGDKRMLPIMLMPNCDQVVKYDANGILSINLEDDTLSEIKSELDDETLQEIRAVWYKLSSTNRTLSDIYNYSLKERIEWFKEAYDTDDFSVLDESIKRYVGILSNKNNAPDFYWMILLDYDWFYTYYKRIA